MPLTIAYLEKLLTTLAATHATVAVMGEHFSPQVAGPRLIVPRAFGAMFLIVRLRLRRRILLDRFLMKIKTLATEIAMPIQSLTVGSKRRQR
jgi:hypothetical protein